MQGFAARVFVLVCISGGIARAATIEAQLPVTNSGPQSVREVTTRDILRVRDIDDLSVAADGDAFAILVREADPDANTYHLSWFVSRVSAKELTYVGDGGEVRVLRYANGLAPAGDLGGGPAKWSPDGQWIAYPLLREGAVQLWRSRRDGSLQEPITQSDADIRDFCWSGDGQRLIYSVGPTRSQLEERRQAGRREGFLLDEFSTFRDIVSPGTPYYRLDENVQVRSIGLNDRADRLATREEEEHLQSSIRQGFLVTGAELNSDFSVSGTRRNDGVSAQFSKIDPKEDGIAPRVRLVARYPTGKIRSCTSEECVSQQFAGVWWHKTNVVFQRFEGVNERETAVYEWSLGTGRVRTLSKELGATLSSCRMARAGLLCIRAIPMLPPHVALLNVSTGSVEVVANVNPEFSHLRLGTVERIEWDLPKDEFHLGYPSRARGYVIYPRGFDPHKKYPVFIAPYVTGGFLRGDGGNEHPLFAYAAEGILVINSEFPSEISSLKHATGGSATEGSFSMEHGFPDHTMLMASTLRALDLMIARGVVDTERVGIGGVSTGTSIPLWIVQQADRFAAVSVGSPTWSHDEPFILTRFGRRFFKSIGIPSWPDSPAYWSKLDLADHVDTIEAPILFQLAQYEAVWGIPRLLRRMDDGERPYEAFIFNDELHEKVQPAHRRAIYDRNLDWFRFWLQDYEDAAPSKTEQYKRWRELRALQCRNPRSVRNYCSPRLGESVADGNRPSSR